MTVPYIFAAQVGTLPLSQLDANFATGITLGATTFQLGDTVPTISGLSLSSPIIVGNILPTVTNTQTIGSVSLLWNNIYSTTFTGELTGNAATVTNGVYTVGNQIIGGLKSFSSIITGSIDGNAATVTDGVYTVGNQTIAGIKTFSSTIVGSINGNAATVTDGVYTVGAQSIAGVKTFTADTILTSTNGGGQLAGLRNRIINGSMLVAQHATSATVTAGTAVPTAVLGYPSVDRFFVYCVGGNVTAAQVNGADTTSKRLQITGVAAVTSVGVGQRIEANNCFDMAGTTCTLSVELSNSLLTTVTWAASYATTTADTFGTIGTATKTSIATGSFTVTATPTIYSANIAVPAAATTGIEILFTVGAQISGTWTVGSVQFEEGTVATPFERLPSTVVTALCQRYYYKISTGATTGSLGGAFTQTTTTYKTWGFFPVVLRALPSTVETTGVFANYSVLHGATTTQNTVLPSLNARSTQYTYFIDNTTGATLPATAGISGIAVASTTTNAFLGFGVEIP
jgi:hypothetical protein